MESRILTIKEFEEAVHEHFRNNPDAKEAFMKRAQTLWRIADNEQRKAIRRIAYKKAERK